MIVAFLAGASPASAADPVFERTFGVGVNGGTGFENCVTPASCVEGVSSGAAGGFNQPSDAVLDTHGGLLVADYTNNRINRYLLNGDGSVSFDRTFGYGVQVGQPPAFQNCTSNCQAAPTSIDVAGALYNPWKITIDNEGRLLVAEYSNGRVSRFNIAANGTASFDRAFGWDVNPGGGAGFETCTTICQKGQPASQAAGSLNGPDGIAVDATGAIYVGEFDIGRISRFTVAANGTPTFDRAFGLDVIPGGPSGFENCTVASTCGPGSATSGAGSASGNYEVNIAPDGRIFAVSSGLSRVDVFTRQSNGTISFQKAFGADVIPGGSTGFEACTTGSGCKQGLTNGDAGSLDGTAGVEFDGAGGLFVTTEGSDRINHLVASGSDFAFDYAYGFGVALGTGPEVCRTACIAGGDGGEAGAFDNPQGMTLSPFGGTLYVADYDNNRVQALTVGPRVTVTKTVSPSSDPGRFDLTINGKTAKAGAGNGGSATVRVASGAAVTISEKATSSANPLSAYDTNIDCGSGLVTATSLTVQNVTGDLTCIVSNTRKPPPAKKANFSRLVLQPKKKKVKAGKKVKLKVKVTNSGTKKGTATVRLTSSSKKKAKVRKTIKVTVGPGKTATKAFKVTTRRKARGKVTIKAKLGKRKAKAVLTLKERR